jgi:predicted nucleic acid-binding protein
MAARVLDAFADTSGWTCWADRRQPFHTLAVSYYNAVWSRGGRIITTSLVLTELTALLTSPVRMPKPAQIQLLSAIRGDPAVEIVFLDAALDAAAWSLGEARPDKDWSLVDCASFELMRRRRLTDALTSDHHFEQAGFVRLLK